MWSDHDCACLRLSHWIQGDLTHHWWNSLPYLPFYLNQLYFVSSVVTSHAVFLHTLQKHKSQCSHKLCLLTEVSRSSTRDCTCLRLSHWFQGALTCHWLSSLIHGPFCNQNQYLWDSGRSPIASLLPGSLSCSRTLQQVESNHRANNVWSATSNTFSTWAPAAPNIDKLYISA